MTDETKVERHASYGAVRITRTQGGDGRLFGSPLRHDYRVSITIAEAELIRESSCDRHHAGRELITIEMSEEQFARFITGGNTHSGTPCTLRRVDGHSVASPPVQLKAERHYEEAKEKVEDAIKTMEAFRKKLELLTVKLPKKTRDELLDALGSAELILADRLPWIVRMMHEHMDKVVEGAKIEIETWINRRLQEGQQLVAREAPVLELPAMEKPNEA